MNTTSTQYDTASRRLLAVLETVPPGAWDKPSPCTDWAARDVVAHLVETQREFLAGRGLDLGPAPDVDADPAARWREHAARVAQVVSDDDVVAAGYDGFFGRTTIGESFEQFYVWDMLVHRWDIARAVGVDADLSDAELDRIEAGADGFGEALYMEGICRPGIEVAPDADRSARVLARLGRQA